MNRNEFDNLITKIKSYKEKELKEFSADLNTEEDFNKINRFTLFDQIMLDYYVHNGYYSKQSFNIDKNVEKEIAEFIIDNQAEFFNNHYLSSEGFDNFGNTIWMNELNYKE